MRFNDRLKRALAVAALAVVSSWFGPNLVTPALAQLKGTQTEGTITPIPIAIPVFLGDDAQLAGDVSNVVQADLERSGLFRPLDRASFLEQVRDVNAAPRFPDWRSIQAEALVVGRIVNDGSGKVGAEFRLWDVASGKQLAGQTIFNRRPELASHRPSDRRQRLRAFDGREGVLRHAYCFRR